MESITFHCKIITPMFLAGADGRTPELRAPSIKGAMRFWWRAMNGHLPLESKIERGKSKNDEKIISAGMQDQEALIFGGTGGNQNACKSSFALQVRELSLNIRKNKLIPHKERLFADSFASDGEFEVSFRLQKLENGGYWVTAPIEGKQTEIFNREKLIALFQLTSILGGLGRRVRRGMGSFGIVSAHSSTRGSIELMETNLEGIHQLLGHFSKYFDYSKSENLIQNNYSSTQEDYPWISQIQIGAKIDNPTFKISKATHEVKFQVDQSPNKREYEATVGGVKKRFASPVYISILPNGSLIITKLNTISPDRRNVKKLLQEELINKIK